MVSQHLQIKYELNNERMGSLVTYPVTVMSIDDSNILTWYTFKSWHGGSHIEACIPFVLYGGGHNVDIGAHT